MSVAELREALEQVHVDPGFVRFVDHARQLGIGVQVVSDGLDYAIQVILAREGQLGIGVQVVSDGLDYAIQVILAREGMGDLPIVANRLLPAGRAAGSWKRPGRGRTRQRQLQVRPARRAASRASVLSWATAARTSASRARPSTCRQAKLWITAAPTASCIPPSSTSTRRCRACP